MPNLSRMQMDLHGPSSAAAALDYSGGDVTFTAPKTPTGFWVGGTGALKVDMQGGGTVTFSAIPAGTLLPIAVTKVYQTGSTVTLTVVLYHDPI